MAPKKSGKKKAPKSKKVKKGGKKKTMPKGKKVKGAKKIAPKATKKKPELKSINPKGAYLTKGELLNNFCVETGLERKMGRMCFEALSSIGAHELKKRGKFVMPGMCRFLVKKRAATKARKGINPFTKEECMFKAKPARQVVKASVVKAFKEL